MLFGLTLVSISGAVFSKIARLVEPALWQRANTTVSLLPGAAGASPSLRPAPRFVQALPGAARMLWIEAAETEPWIGATLTKNRVGFSGGTH